VATSREITLGSRPIRSAITRPPACSAIPRGEISSRSASVNILRTLTVLLIGSVSPTIYTKINCYDRLGSREIAELAEHPGTRAPRTSPNPGWLR